MKKKAFNLIVILLSVLVLLFLVILNQGVEGLIKQIASLNYLWLASAMLCMLLYWSFDAIILHIITKFLDKRQRIMDSVKVTMVGQLFNSITPFASGGQPAQLYVMIREGVEGGHAGSILMIKFIVFQVILTIYSAIIIIMKAAFFEPYTLNFFYLVIIGFCVHASIIFVLVLFSYNRTLTQKTFNVIFKVLKRLKLKQIAGNINKKFYDQLDSFHANTKIIKNNKNLLAKTSFLTLLQFSAFNMIPYFIYRSFGLDSESIWNLVAAQVFVMMVVSFIPLPGGAGGAEGGFYLFFKMFYDNITIVPALFIWRIITFYSCICIGGLFSMMSTEKHIKNKVET